MNGARTPAKMTLRRLPLSSRKFRACKRLGNIVFNIDRFRLVVLGDFLQALFLLRISRRLGLTRGACGLVAQIISCSVNISVHLGPPSDRQIRAPLLPPETHPETFRGG